MPNTNQPGFEANPVPPKAVDDKLFMNMPTSVRQIQALARKELRAKQRAIFKAQHLDTR